MKLKLPKNATSVVITRAAMRPIALRRAIHRLASLYLLLQVYQIDIAFVNALLIPYSLPTTVQEALGYYSYIQNEPNIYMNQFNRLSEPSRQSHGSVHATAKNICSFTIFLFSVALLSALNSVRKSRW